eukprot:scaffold1808_cov360-Prasinococcus_capsulatus_cf.AAC.8
MPSRRGVRHLLGPGAPPRGEDGQIRGGPCGRRVARQHPTVCLHLPHAIAATQFAGVALLHLLLQAPSRASSGLEAALRMSLLEG